MDGRWGPGGLRFRCFFFSEISQKFGMFFGRLVRMPKYWYNFATFPKLVFIQSVSSTGVKQYILPSMIRPKGETIWRRASRSTFCDWTSPQPPTISHLQLQENENYDRLLQSTAAISSSRGPSSNCFFGGGVAKTRWFLTLSPGYAKHWSFAQVIGLCKWARNKLKRWDMHWRSCRNALLLVDVGWWLQLIHI